MKLGLAAIKEFVQQIVEAIAASIGVEVMVFNTDRNIVAGTGETKAQVGSRYNKGSLTGRLIDSGKPIIARSPGFSPECEPCNRYGACQRRVVVAHPIKVEGKILGSFCLVALDDQQKHRVLDNEENLLRFLDRMCMLIGSAISEKRIQDEMSVLLKRYNNVVNSVHEGIIATDEAGRIIHCNRSAANILGIPEIQVLNMQLNNLFPDIPPIKTFTNKKTVEKEISYRHKGRNRYYLATIVPVLKEENKEIRGLTVSLRNLSEVQSYASKLIGEYSKYNFQDILGQSKGIIQVKEKLNKAALTDSTILIRGESGTGKELFAHAVHNASYRARGPFVAINCSAIPESLLESELFGYEEGAFTGAKKGGKPGKFELAGGGTLFLDEIGDMPLHLQSKLLRVLENRSIERVGGTESIPINVRIIAATNRNLEEMAEKYEFRGDLYYRLSVIPIFIPSLKEREEDIPILIQYFLEKYSSKLNRDLQQLDAQAVAKLTCYPWPGNVRELQNAIEYAINMSEPGQLITLEHLPQRILFALPDNPAANEQAWKNGLIGLKSKEWVVPGSPVENQNRKNNTNGEAFYSKWAVPGDNESLEELQQKNCPRPKLKSMEIEAIREALNRFGTSTGGKEKAARYLGISLATLYRRLKVIEGS